MTILDKLNGDDIRCFTTLKIGEYVLNVYGTEEYPLFVAKEVAEALEYNRHICSGYVDTAGMVKLLNKEEGECVKTQYTRVDGKKVRGWLISEFGLYEILMTTKKPNAKLFRRYIKNILKQIRLTGGYIPVQDEESPEALLKRAYAIAERTLQYRDKVDNTNTEIGQL